MVLAMALTALSNFLKSLEGVIVGGAIATLMLCTFLICAAIDDRGNRL
jgi:hypothetical protein